MASTDARPVPRKNVAFRVYFPILDADGDLVTGAAGLDSEVSVDGGTFADCTNEATEIATSSGMYYLDLTSGEMNGDAVCIIVKTSTSGAKTTPIVLYPEESGDYRCNVVQIEGSDPTDTIRDAVVDDATRIDASALNTLSGHDPGETIMGATDLGTGTGFTAIPWNAAWDAEVQSEVTDALNTYDPPTNAELVSEINAVQADIAALNNLASSDVEAAVLSALDTDITATPTAGSVNDVLNDLDARLPASGTLATSANVSAVETDTQDIQSRLPAALNNGCIPADVQRVNDVEIVGDGSVTPFDVA